MLRSTAIVNFLTKYANHPVASLYDPNMEVYVAVDPKDGVREGKSWTDGIERWFNFRDTDKELSFDLSKHAFAIGMSGWDKVNKVSCWVGFDFDSIVGHQSGLSNHELDKILTSLKNIPWATIYRSTSGRGFHIYIFFDPAHYIHTANRKEHAAVARGCLNKLCGLTGLDLKSSVDSFGHILWIWHKNQAINGFEEIKRGKFLKNLPEPQGKTLTRKFNNDSVSLGEDHLTLIRWLEKQDISWWWDDEKQLLVCHTYDLKRAHEELNLKGRYNTLASGKDKYDYNCFLTPIEDGGWIVRRFTAGCKEHHYWTKDKYTSIKYNVPLELENSGGLLTEKNEYIFKDINVLTELGLKNITIPFSNREFRIKELNNGYLISQTKEDGDERPANWYLKGKDRWCKVVPKPLNRTRIRVPHDKIRHVICNGVFQGWWINTGQSWVKEPKNNVISYLLNLGYNRQVTEEILGKTVEQTWEIVTEPFKPEYLGKRKWNKDAAALSFNPKEGAHPTWNMILDNCGKDLDYDIENNNWCKLYNITNGRDFIFLWVAWMIQRPSITLPYLFFYGPQSSGKSTLHEALSLIFKNRKGCVRADVSLTSKQRFNAELQGAVLCIIEETDLSKENATVYNRLKDWVTAPYITIHPKGQTPYDVENRTHWIQCANAISSCPILPGDTRIIVSHVDKPNELIDKQELMNNLIKEGPAFLHDILNYELPPPVGRLTIPIIETSLKKDEQIANLNPVESFINDYCYYVPGEKVLYGELCERMQQKFDISKRGIGRLLPPHFPKGRSGSKSQWYVGNLSFEPGKGDSRNRKYKRIGESLVLV